MNIIVTNKYRDLIYGTNIEVLKELNGVFKVSQILNSFSSIFFKKIIIDATALEDFPKQSVLTELAKSFDMDKLILFLPPDNPPPKKFLSFLVSLNIYNFTDNPRGLLELIQRNNTYDNVKEYVVEDKIEINNNQEQLNDDIYSNTGRFVLGLLDLQNNNHSTKLIYIIKKVLEANQKKVLSLEIDKKNFVYYRTDEMFSISNNQINNYLSGSTNYDVILIDSNNSIEKYTDDVIYLLDPSLFEVNKMLYSDRMIFQKLQGKKIVFVNSLLSEKDVQEFAKEANISIYYNLPPLNDRIVNKEIEKFLIKLGILTETSEKNTKKGLFDFFK